MRPGQPVTVTVDTYPGRAVGGHGRQRQPGEPVPQFSLLPAQNASGNWVKVVQRIPVRVAVDDRAGEPPLRAGMSAEIEIDTGHRRQLRDLLAWLLTRGAGDAPASRGGRRPATVAWSRSA